MMKSQLPCIAMIFLLSATGACSVARAQTSDEKLITEAKAQQKKVEEVGKKLLDAGKAYREAAEGGKSNAEELGKAVGVLRSEYDKEAATLRTLKAKLDELSKQGGKTGDDASKARDGITNGLTDLIRNIIEAFLGPFLSGLTKEQKTAFLDSSTKAVLGEPLSAKDLEALAKIPDFSKATGNVADFYQSLQAAKDWPAIRDKIVDATVEQLGETSPVGQAAAALSTALKSGPSVSVETIVAAVKKPLPGGKFTQRAKKEAFMNMVRTIAPREVADALNKIQVDE
jgi:hypothetical protein